MAIFSFVPEKSSSLSESECGLKTCGWPKVETALVNMVEAAKSARHHVGGMTSWVMGCLIHPAVRSIAKNNPA